MTVEKLDSEKTSPATPVASVITGGGTSRRSYSVGRRIFSILNLGVIVVLCLYILTVFNLIVYRHPRRVDLTFERIHTLSDATKDRLKWINQPIRVIVPYFFQNESPLHNIQRQIFSRARALLNEFQVLQPRIVVAHELNIGRHDDSLEWGKLCEEYDLDSNQFNRFYFMGPDEKLRQVVNVDDLALYDRPTAQMDRTPPKIHKFRAEEAFITALIRLTRGEMPTVCFATDWSQASVSDDGQSGLYKLKRALQLNGYAVEEVALSRRAAVPSSCDLLVVAGASSNIDVADRQKIQDYLLQDGRLWVALGPTETGIEDLLAEWGMNVVPGQILQKQLTVGGLSRWSNFVLSSGCNGLHPIAEEFSRDGFQVLGANLRPLDPVGKQEFSGEVLLKTRREPESFVDTNSNRVRDDDERRGSIVFAATMSQPRPDRPPPGFSHKATRIAVFGDWSLFSNAWIDKYSHRVLTLNTVRWLLGHEEEVTGETDKSWQDQVISWSPTIHQFLFWVPIFLFPGVVLGLGIAVFFLRRV
jgi:hypothetical protein